MSTKFSVTDNAGLEPVSFNPRAFLREAIHAWVLVHSLVASQPFRPRAI